MSRKFPNESELHALERAAASICRRHRLSRDDGEDFTSEVKVKVCEKWEQICQDYQGRAKLESFLYSLALHLLLDKRDKDWGTWRHSKTARALGPDAMRLDELLYFEKLPRADAIRILKMDPCVTRSEGELEEIARLLPPHGQRREVPLDDLPLDTAHRADEDPVVAAEDEALKLRLEQVFESLLNGLPQPDHSIVTLHYFQKAPLARVAKVLDLEQKPLYRRLEKIEAELGRRIEAAGFDAATVLGLIGRPEFDVRVQLKNPHGE